MKLAGTRFCLQFSGTLILGNFEKLLFYHAKCEYEDLARASFSASLVISAFLCPFLLEASSDLVRSSACIILLHSFPLEAGHSLELELS